jgi:hypothetical protein
VADEIGKPASSDDMEDFVERHVDLLGTVSLKGVDETFEVTQDLLRNTAGKFLAAVKKAGEVYRKIEQVKGADNFIPEERRRLRRQR